MKYRTLVDFAFDRNTATHQVNQLRADGQPESRSAELTGCGHVCLGESFKDLCLPLGGNANSRIFHGNVQTANFFQRRLALDPHNDRAPIGELDCIVNQIRKDLPQAGHISYHHIRYPGRYVIGDLQALVMGPSGKRA